MRIAETAVAALGQHDALAELGEIGDQRFFVLVVNLRADRNLQHHDGAAASAVAVLALAGHAGARLEVLLVTVVDQRVEAVDRLDHHGAAMSAIAAARAAELDELLAAERHAAVAAVAGADIDLCLIEEFHGCLASGVLPLIYKHRPGLERMIHSRMNSTASSSRAAIVGIA